MQGLHLVAELYHCAGPADRLVDVAALRSLCLDAVGRSGLHAVGELFHSFAPRPLSLEASPGGLTGVVLLAESHLAVHTWPEYGTVTLDVYTCNHGADHARAAEALVERLVAAFAPARVATQRVRRGAVAPGDDGA